MGVDENDKSTRHQVRSRLSEMLRGGKAHQSMTQHYALITKRTEDEVRVG